MPKIVFPQKDPADTYLAVFDFTSYAALTDSIIAGSSIVSASVYSGTDANPSAIIFNSLAVPTPFVVNQYIIGGVNGVTYQLSCTATFTSGAVTTLTGYLSVLQTLL